MLLLQHLSLVAELPDLLAELLGCAASLSHSKEVLLVSSSTSLVSAEGSSAIHLLSTAAPTLKEDMLDGHAPCLAVMRVSASKYLPADQHSCQSPCMQTVTRRATFRKSLATLLLIGLLSCMARGCGCILHCWGG